MPLTKPNQQLRRDLKDAAFARLGTAKVSVVKSEARF